MFGEIRDEEIVVMVVRVLIIGYKVYSIIYCKLVRDVYLRFENMGIKFYLIDDVLIGIIF